MGSASEKKPTPSTFGAYCKLLANKNKLVLYHVSTSKQLKLHHELKPIMETYGFVCLSDPEEDANSSGAEYSFPVATAAAGDDSVLPTLPSHRIDGLHIYTYRAFLDAVNRYLQIDDISDLFTVQSIPLRLPPDARLTWRLAEVDNQRFVYRAQTLKQEVFDFYDRQGTTGSSINAGRSGNRARNTMSNSRNMYGCTSSNPVPLEDSIVTDDDQNKNDSPDESDVKTSISSHESYAKNGS